MSVVPKDTPVGDDMGRAGLPVVAVPVEGHGRQSLISPGRSAYHEIRSPSPSAGG